MVRTKREKLQQLLSLQASLTEFYESNKTNLSYRERTKITDEIYRVSYFIRELIWVPLARAETPYPETIIVIESKMNIE